MGQTDKACRRSHSQLLGWLIGDLSQVISGNPYSGGSNQSREGGELNDRRLEKGISAPLEMPSN